MFNFEKCSNLEIWVRSLKVIECECLLAFYCSYIGMAESFLSYSAISVQKKHNFATSP